jgi:cobyrinic acid a,c-diamide synthase
MNAFATAGLRVQPFKVGPDFIDPSYHTAATRVYSKNLDTWLTSPEAVLRIFLKSSRMCDLAIIEGVMGLFDGASSDDSASTAEISKILNAPVILVVDVSKMAGSSAALVHGFKTFDQKLKIKGVILNHVKSQKHMDLSKQAIKNRREVRVVGALPSSANMSMPSRHLGLIPARERDDLSDFLTRLRSCIEQYLDLDQILEIARGADELETDQEESPRPLEAQDKPRIGIAYDEAFNFYYRDNIEELEANGADVVFFSPIHDSRLPSSLDGMFIGGGFPEAYAKELEENQSMRKSVRDAVQDEMPIYAECGGLMYFVESIQDLERSPHKMIGVLNGKATMGGVLESLNYSLAHVVRKNLLSDVGFTLRGHEFHYSRVEDVSADAEFAYEMEKGKGIFRLCDGWMQHNLLASYMHIHFGYSSQLAKNLVEACRRYELT